jgi:hypothetical protein
MATLNKPIVLVPAIEAITGTTFDIVDVQENYGYGEVGTGFGSAGRHNSVYVTICFPTTPNPTLRSLIAWQGDEYLAVRGTWTDETLTARIAEILENE